MGVTILVTKVEIKLRFINMFYNSNVNLTQTKTQALLLEELCSGMPEFMQCYKKHYHLMKNSNRRDTAF